MSSGESSHTSQNLDSHNGMQADHLDLDRYDEYESITTKHALRGQERAAHRQSKHRIGHRAKTTREQIVQSITAENDTLINFVPSYVQNLDPKHNERRWIIDSLGGFYRDKIITDVTHIVKGGKEANVYGCMATSETGHERLAAKIYRPRMLRHLKNDAAYKEGRFVRDQSGKEIRKSRSMRALEKKTKHGKMLDFATWIVHEYGIHQMLYNAGFDVPQPIAYRNNTILMEYIGDEHQPAHTLIDTTLPQEEVAGLFEQIMENIERMLAMNYVHGDLSAYNILYWDGEVYIIDFPQVVDARQNGHAFRFFERDVRRICEYFQKYGQPSDPGQIAAELWQDYIDGRL